MITIIPPHATFPRALQRPFSCSPSSILTNAQHSHAAPQARQLRGKGYVSARRSMLIVEVRMADKHETAPTARKAPREFRETVKIGSASSWNKVTLTLFHVAFDRKNFSNLRDFLDLEYFECPTSDQDYCRRNLSCFVTDDRLRKPYAGLGGRKRGRFFYREGRFGN